MSDYDISWYKSMTNIRTDFEKSLFEYYPDAHFKLLSCGLYASGMIEIAWEMYKTGIRHAVKGVD